MNAELDLAWHIVTNTDTNIFLTGKAGTGKTTFLRELRRVLPKRMVVLAPTGIAAINAQGVTIHSFFQLGLGPQLPNQQQSTQKHSFRKQKIRLIRSLDLVIIDEISMVRADILDAVDNVLRQFKDKTKPFGGAQMLMIGDMQQLPPVTKDEEWRLISQYYQSPYFFSSYALQQSDFVTIDLQHVYRQSDNVFLELLNKVRTNTIDERSLQMLNSRCDPTFVPDKNEGYIRLCTHNRQAEAINNRELEELKTTLRTFQADINGDFPATAFPTEKMLQLKVGAQVMFIKNDSSPAKEFFNGMIGEVEEFISDHILVRCLDSGKVLKVGRETWENIRYTLDEKSKEITEEVIGTFEQYPLKTAWAITIHKSQGLTFSKAIIDVQYSFTHGQTYVALSRCKTLEGMVLSSPIPRSAIICDTLVEDFYNDPRHQQPDEERIRQMEQQYTIRTIDSLFSLLQLTQVMNGVIRMLREHYYSQLPKTYAKWQETLEKTKALVPVTQQFKKQYSAIILNNDDNFLQERLKKGAAYFEEQLLFIRITRKGTILNTDNRALRKRIDDLLTTFDNTYKIKIQLLHHVANNGFNLQDYLNTKAKILLRIERNT